MSQGWFVGQMIKGGWLWAIPLTQDRFSVGVVLKDHLYDKEKAKADELFNNCIHDSGFFEKVFSHNPERLTPLQTTANINYSSRQLNGPGWTLVGDAGFFVDPCFSSGVHLALSSGELAAQLFLEGKLETTDYYEKRMREHEINVTYMVDHFYAVSNIPLLQKISSSITDRKHQTLFNTFIGGDFSLNPDFAKSSYDSVMRIYNKSRPNR